MRKRPFRFGVINETILHGADWFSHVRQIEELGYSTFLIRDHFVPDFFGHQLAPLPALTAAAMVTRTLRVGTLVLDNDYRHPVMLAKEAATLDQLSGGRLELGIGAGWLRVEYQQAGMNFDPAGKRIDRLEEAIKVLKGLWKDEVFTSNGAHYSVHYLHGYPPPAQRPHPPLLIGAGKRRMLRLAGREADIVSILTTSVSSGTLLDDPAERQASRVHEKIAWIRERAGERFDQIELSLIPQVILDRDRERRVRDLIQERGWNHISVEDVLAMPSILVGSIDQIVDTLRRRRDEFGFSYYVVSDSVADAFAPVVHQLSGT